MTTFTFAGISTLNGTVKVRYANDMERTKVLEKNGHSGIDLVPLPFPSTKSDAVQYLIDIDFGDGNASITAILDAEKVRLDAQAAKLEKARGPAPTAFNPAQDSPATTMQMAMIIAQRDAEETPV